MLGLSRRERLLWVNKLFRLQHRPVLDRRVSHMLTVPCRVRLLFALEPAHTLRVERLFSRRVR